jgi:hypothetical protein
MQAPRMIRKSCLNNDEPVKKKSWIFSCAAPTPVPYVGKKFEFAASLCHGI